MKTKDNRFSVHLEKNSFTKEGEDTIVFPKGLTITDGSEQYNGTRYDIDSMDLSDYNQMLTADHSWSIQEVIGKTYGIKKDPKKKRVTIDSIKFAVKESALARFAYNMIVGGFLGDFSIETTGPYPDEEGKYFNSQLVNLSLVVMGNNKSASLNDLKAVAANSIERSKEDGLDTSLVEERLSCYDHSDTETDSNKETAMKFVTLKNSRAFSVVINYKNASGEEMQRTLIAGETVDVSEDQKDAVQNQITGAQEPRKEEIDHAKIVTDAVNAALAPVTAKIEKLEKSIVDNSANEPQFKQSTKAGEKGELESMNHRDRHAIQINAYMDMEKGDSNARAKLVEVNKFHLEKLQEKNIVPNAITIADMGNFVISPELLTEIEGFRSNFTPLLSRLNYKETLSLQMAWLTRSGDINMQEVEMCDDGEDGNLKPISEYGATIKTSNLHELAAVTPVCDAATRFLAADLLSDVAGGYRNDYDRKRAQLFVARLQQAVNETGNTSVYGTTSALASLQSFIGVAAQMQESVMGGVYILSQKSYWELVRQELGAGINVDSGFRIFTSGDAGPLLLGVPYIIVPNELLPTLNTAETRSFIVEGVTVTITQAVFYVDLSTFSGRTSGGLKYDLSTHAAYEVGETVRSAFQRNEVVLRGSFFRGGAIRDPEKVTGLGSPGVS